MLYHLSFQVQSEDEQHDDVDYESLVEDQSESIDDPTGANDSKPYQSIDEGKSINVRALWH